MTSSTLSDAPETEYLSVGLDLAERYSGLVALNADGTLDTEMAYDFGPRDNQETRDAAIEDLIRDIKGMVALRRVPLSQYGLLIEDIPPHGMVNPKPILRQQGYIFRELRKAGIQYELILPRQWQLPLGYKRKEWSTTKAWAKSLSGEMGFTSELGGKSAVDTRDAYLIAHFGLQRWLGTVAVVS